MKDPFKINPFGNLTDQEQKAYNNIRLYQENGWFIASWIPGGVSGRLIDNGKNETQTMKDAIKKAIDLGLI